MGLLQTTQAFAHCSDVDMRKPGGTMEGVAVQDQGRLGICAFMSSCLMAQAYLKRAGTPLTIDPVVLAAEASARNEQDYLKAVPRPSVSPRNHLMDGAVADEPIEYLKKYGACNQTFGATSKRSADFFKTSIEQIQSGYSNEDQSGTWSKFQDLRCRAANSPDIVSKRWADSVKEIQQKEIQRIRNSTLGPISFAVETMYPKCAENRTPVSIPSVKLDRSVSRMSKLEELMSVTEPKPTPVQINYCSKMLYHGDQYLNWRKKSEKEWVEKTKSSDEEAPDFCEYHASIVIGRRQTDDGKCQYLVQNSWGTTCDPYEKAKGHGIQCQEGRLWIDQSVLEDSVKEVIHFP